jgi:hypothetical protein
MRANLSHLPTTISSRKVDLIMPWIEQYWAAERPQYVWLNTWSNENVVDERVLAQIAEDTTISNGFAYAGMSRVHCPQVPRLYKESFGESGAFAYAFANAETGERFEVLVVCMFTDEDGYHTLMLASIPRVHLAVWEAFADLCTRTRSKLNAGQKVHVIGGRMTDFQPSIDWGDMVLPEELMNDILKDVSTFFERGIAVYQRLKLKPFRKLLLAGVPGTGKTMLCTALAKWALEQGYLVVYVSSADWEGPNFVKIDRALNIAANAEYPTLIILEEIDAYLHEKQKAMVLNVLDGNEARMNPHGTLIVATTNYPEAIDERVLKRPGRLDRIFIIPPLIGADHAERMLKMFLGDEWRNEHRALVPKLVGYPGAFVREVAIYAMTQFAYLDEPDLPLELLMRSFNALKAQIDSRDDLNKHRKVGRGLGFEATEKHTNGVN